MKRAIVLTTVLLVGALPASAAPKKAEAKPEAAQTAPAQPPEGVKQITAYGDAPSAEQAPLTAVVAPAPAPEQVKPKVEIGGYLAPAYALKYRPRALPDNKWEYGWGTGSAGLEFSGEPLEKVTFDLTLVVDVDMIRAITDTKGTKKSWAGTLMDTVTISYQPIEHLKVKAGVFRIPFTIPNRSANTDLMFPTRAGPNQVFMSGSDQGVTVSGDVLGKRILATAGMFNGSSLGLLPQTVAGQTRGPVYSARLDFHPLGEFAFAENDKQRGPLRVGVGGGFVYRNATIFDDAGYESVYTRDFRWAATARVALKGLYAQAEYLRYQRTDSFTNRPRIADGYYGQASYYIAAMPSLGIQPVARVGYSMVDEETDDPRENIWLDGGLAFYPSVDPKNPNALRVIVQYAGAITDEETAHGMETSLQLTW